ncbi:hypothetical protein GCM10020331_052740 [Ectobacillus funiculus]
MPEKLANYTDVKARQLWTTLYLCAKEKNRNGDFIPCMTRYTDQIYWRRLKAGVMENAQLHDTEIGAPQGGLCKA